MRLLFTVQRYGPGVAGGAESACRSLAERMTKRGHHVEVLTSCAVDYVTWADQFEPGSTELDGVLVHRLPVRSERTTSQFGLMSQRVLGPTPAALAVERDWVRVQGPDLPRLGPWLTARAGRFDVAIFYTYLYPTSALGLPVAARQTATVLHPAAHDEPPMQLKVYDDLMAHADALSVHTPEERETLERRFNHLPPITEIGLGVDMDPPVGDGARFRASIGLADEPILLYVGRIEPAKASDELARMFAEYKRRHPGDLQLVMVGAVVRPVEAHPDIHCTGFISDQERADAVAASTIFVMPSYFESFSIALCESWVARRPALVQGGCAVLRGQVARSGGGLAYDDFAEFEASLTRLVDDPALRAHLGERGGDFVARNFGWEAVLDRYGRLLADTVVRRSRRMARSADRAQPGSRAPGGPTSR